MQCDRCHFENYDEAYSCRKCGAKLNKNKRNNSDFTSPQDDFRYNNYNQQQSNFNYQNSYNQPQNDYNYQNNYNQSQGNYNYNQQPNGYNYQNNNNQQYNYNRNNQNFQNRSTSFTAQEMDRFSKVPADGKIHRLVDEKTEYQDNKVVHTETTTYVTRKRVSPRDAHNFGINNDSELHQMYENFKSQADYQQQYNPAYNSNNNSFNNYNYNPNFNNYNNKSRNNKSKIILVIIIVVALAIGFAFGFFRWQSENNIISSFIEQPTEKPTVNTSALDNLILKPSNDKCKIVDESNPNVSVEFSVPEGYNSKMYSRKDNALVRRYDNDINTEDSIVEASVSIIEDNTELNLSFYKNFYESSGLQICSEETTKTALGTMTYIKTLVNEDEFYLGFIDLDNNRCLTISTSHLVDYPEYNYEAKELLMLIAHTAQ